MRKMDKSDWWTKTFSDFCTDFCGNNVLHSETMYFTLSFHVWTEMRKLSVFCVWRRMAIIKKEHSNGTQNGFWNFYDLGQKCAIQWVMWVGIERMSFRAHSKSWKCTMFTSEIHDFGILEIAEKTMRTFSCQCKVTLKLVCYVMFRVSGVLNWNKMWKETPKNKGVN